MRRDTLDFAQSIAGLTRIGSQNRGRRFENPPNKNALAPGKGV
jgi:hypothetical protein